MRHLVEVFGMAYNQNKQKAEILPFVASKHLYIKSIYNLCYIVNEIVYRVNNNIESVYNNTTRTSVNSIYNSMLDLTDKIRGAENLEEMNQHYDSLLINTMTLNGMFSTYDELSHAVISRYDDYYSNININPLDLIHNVLRNIQGYRNETRVFTMLGSELGNRNNNAFNCSFMDSILRSSHVIENNNLKYYCFIDTNVPNDMEQYENYIEKHIVGSTSDVRISNNFDISIMGLRRMEYYANVSNRDNNIFRNRFFILNTHTGVGGLEIILLPKVFINDNVVETLCGYLENVNVFSLQDNSSFVAITGNRKKKVSHNLLEEMDFMITLLKNKASSPTVKYYNLESDKFTFRSAVPQLADVTRAINNNIPFLNKFNNNISKKLVVKTEEDVKHPLIPFSPGQLGLVLVSGKIDGIIDEGNGIYHVIKGTTYKTNQQRTTVDEEGHRVRSTTYATATSVSMLTADGEFIDLR